ncbi:hypothetical protein KM1_073910 [Entamoeba histolytica HM-3:IMSS]|uniref:Uncharacterized protein n=5 Tax=Entamoeba histolytica TaxID=5759 RepID=C4LTS2_ENTH1|nr:hypothetical protein EHI_050490 [Entamoeba histolytica HM-1:IMSS]EMD44973.1 Hypothetical protein EHI5A_057670 [Entamoeba histolytica KU27]EMS13489.1 hypothetical protein KM1_073910 [Entamoeba histolytica HM-3:IMSS]ENY65162.1 hypothetical protein EHI7A_035380 [Entamoeba histolytica HM-1:IMSS-A]GAT91978.1 hypothetical protein CL6EHI_050490 [Entamoeba histolytica]EAL45949.1 hypothetical protein EHI_050490 [Entamoeba histolytica HM-1:IMSS]|eukprot:XP_651337.1 hypothetical protein EHI_050490 [Entamoeba histolytica HM-1:IMSS]
MNRHKHSVKDFRKYKDKVNYLISLQSIYLALLNKYATIELKRRSVKSTVTLPFLCVSKITFSQLDTILVWKLIEDKIHHIFVLETNNNIEKAIAASHVKKNRLNVSIQLLEDFLFEKGYRYTYSLFYRKDGSISGEVSIGIYCNNILQYDINAIKTIGSSINNYLTSQLKNNPTVDITKGDPIICDLLNK